MFGRISAVAIVALAILALLTAFATFLGVNQDVDAPAAGAREKVVLQSSDSPGRSATGDAWNIDYAASYIRFSGIESGGAFEGEWQHWTALIQFDAAALDTSVFDVRIVATDVETGNDDRDDALQLSTWFDTDNYPEIIYGATQFADGAENGFIANGFLTIREKRTPVRLKFKVSEKGARLALDGNTELDRIALEVGTSEFADTRWINQFVDVVVHIETAD
jgi:polyisoprenoid-binding protein YceI